MNNDIKGKTDVRGGSEARGDTDIRGSLMQGVPYCNEGGTNVSGNLCKRGH